MAKLVWDETGSRLYETGTSHGVLYPFKATGEYDKGVAWNGLISVSENPTGGDADPLWADDIKYLELRAREDFEASIEAYTYPDEFAACDGSVELVPGVTIGQQTRQRFGMSYKTLIGNDVKATDYGYKLHLLYGCAVSPSQKQFQTVNDSPEAITFSWDLTTTPVNVTGHLPTACLTIDSTKVPAEKLTALEAILYGDSENEARLPLPDEVASLLAAD